MKPSEFIKEEFDSKEYSDEAGMVKNNIHTIVRVMTHLCRELKDDEDMPEWVQEKIASAKGMLVGVMDYMISQHEQGIQPTVAECTSGATGSSAVSSSMGGGDGFGWSEFYKESSKPAAKRKSNMRKR